MLVISDSYTFLLENVAKTKNIHIQEIINFDQNSCKNFENPGDYILILLSESLYKILENNNNFELEEAINFILKTIKEIINKLSKFGSHIYIPFVPKHFIFCDRYGDKFYDKNSQDILIQNFNHKLYLTFGHFRNVTFLKGIENLSSDISKNYFRFFSIYDKENSIKIIEQIQEHIERKTAKEKKLIILDLDNTIWKGTLGDDSLAGITIDKSDPIGAVYRYAQKIFIQLKKRGFLLAICSKNSKDYALKALFNSPSSLFSEEDIITYEINWNAKSQNIHKICKNLNVSLLDTIFVDDSDYECDEVQANCKGISIFKVPKNIYKYPFMLTSSELFYKEYVSSEDEFRTDLYKKNIERELLKSKIESDDCAVFKWIESLNLRLNIENISPNDPKIPRIIQLFNRTNQFNLSGSKYSEFSFNKSLNDNTYYFGEAFDRIGSEGLISVIGFKLCDKSIFVKDFILSCRVFGRYIEESMLLPILDNALKKNCDIYFNLIENNRNNVILKFLKKISNDNYHLSISDIKRLCKEFEKLPVKINDFSKIF